jgi:hypothetical protein
VEERASGNPGQTVKPSMRQRIKEETEKQKVGPCHWTKSSRKLEDPFKILKIKSKRNK